MFISVTDRENDGIVINMAEMSPMTSHMEELDRGWSWVVLVASFGYFMIFGMFLYGIGMVHEILLEEYGGKSSSTAWAGSLYASLVSLGGNACKLFNQTTSV